jgi:ribosome biogenesis GTPase
MQAVVRRSTGSWYDIVNDKGELLQARIKGKFKLEGKKTTNPVAVGDIVEYEPQKNEDSVVITRILQRRNYIIRKANNLSKQEHIIAANLDQVLIMATLIQPRTSQGFIDRVLVTAEAYEIPAVIAFNKIDLFDEKLLEVQQEMCAMYEQLGYPCFSVSVKKEINLDHLKEVLQGKTTLLTGHSGVGKSSLLNYLMPELKLKTAAISEFSMKGKHTTTFAEMHEIGENTYIIDTPGIKEFGMVDMNKEEVSHYFPEMRELLGQCRFNNCLHINEPGCAVIEALEEGKIELSRYNSYLSIVQGEDTHR